MRLLPVSVLATLLLSACDKGDAPPRFGDPVSGVSPKLHAFADCDEFRGYLVDSFVESVVQSRYGYAYGALAEDADSGSSESPADYSTTNVQEAGVDEPDIVKTDGDYLYVVQQGRAELTILDSWPAEETAVVGRVELEGYPYSAFLRGDTMAVFQYVYGEDYGSGSTNTALRDGYGTRISLIDVSDRANPVVVRDIDVEGWLASARLVENDAYVVMNNWFSMPGSIYERAWDETLGLPEYDYDASDFEQAADRAVARGILYPIVRAEVAALNLDDLLPRWYGGADGAWSEEGAVVTCADLYHPEGVAQPGLLTVVHLDLDAPATTTPSATGLFANGWTVYASQESLYVSQASWWWSWGWADTALNTHVHRFALEGEDTVYASSGEVPGWQWSQFSLDEEDGYLRMATSSQDWWWGTDSGDTGSGVYVLQEQGGTLDVVGQVEGIAPGEMIYGVRFVGDIAWLVTFLQVDPLFAIDLSVPTSPEVIGELEIPGFSSYIHPLEGGYLLTAGMAGTDDGDITGFAVKLFDVRDPTQPTLLDEAVVSSDDWSYSDALWDHHAFTFHNGVLTVPIYTYDYDEGGGWSGFSGLWVLEVDTAAGLTELGRVDHADLVDASACLYDYDGAWGTAPCPDDWWYAWMRRGVIMEDTLFSVSDYGVKVSDLHVPDETLGSAVFWPAE